MIAGTRPFKGKKNVASPTMIAQEPAVVEASQPTAVNPDATNLGRRAWFRSLAPTFGAGLVEILRMSNHLKQELAAAYEERTDGEVGNAETKRSGDLR